MVFRGLVIDSGLPAKTQVCFTELLTKNYELQAHKANTCKPDEQLPNDEPAHRICVQLSQSKLLFEHCCKAVDKMTQVTVRQGKADATRQHEDDVS